MARGFLFGAREKGGERKKTKKAKRERGKEGEGPGEAGGWTEKGKKGAGRENGLFVFCGRSGRERKERAGKGTTGRGKGEGGDLCGCVTAGSGCTGGILLRFSFSIALRTRVVKKKRPDRRFSEVCRKRRVFRQFGDSGFRMFRREKFRRNENSGCFRKKLQPDCINLYGMARIGVEIAKGSKRMETKNPKNLNKLLYIVIVAVLCVTAIVIGITAAANRGSKTPLPTTPIVTAPPVTTNPPAVEKEPTPAPPPANVLPEFSSPAVGVVAKGHDDSLPVYSMTMNDWRIHTGIDIACSIGDDVLAAADGEICGVLSDPMMGTTVRISHSGEGETIYKNLSVTLPDGVKVGARVKAGQVIGTVGDTAMIEGADEPHLHFEMKVKGASVDPLRYISKESREAALKVDSSYET